jgi:hypothetical protein
VKTYHGERTEQGCEVTVDGAPLRACSNLSGNATTELDWGYIGNGQLSLALLSNLLGDDAKATAMSEAFEREVVANLPHDRWTISEYEFARALDRLVGVDGERAYGATSSRGSGAGAGELLVESSTVLVPDSLRLEDATSNAAMVSEGGHLDVPTAVSNAARDEARGEAARTEVRTESVAREASDAAVVAQAARDADRASDTPADEAMTTTNREADHDAYSAQRAADKALAVARDAARQRYLAD